jgi:hypothetical protein
LTSDPLSTVLLSYLFFTQDAKRDRRRQRILEAAEYWAAKREDPYVDEFYKTQVAKDEAYANRWEFVCCPRRGFVICLLKFWGDGSHCP